MKVELSVIIVSHNTKKLTLDCIKSVIKESKDLRLEIIVIDNGSSDGSVESLTSHLPAKITALQAGRSLITNHQLIKNQRNLGFSKANNQGIKIAKGKYILLLNSDTKVVSGAFLKLLDFAKQNNDVGVIGARLLNKDGSIQPSVLRFPTLLNAAREYWLGEKGLFEKYIPGGKNPSVVDVVVGAAFFITPDALKKVGVLNEKYFFYFEDIDYCREIKRVGLKVYYLPYSKITHYHGASGKHVASDDNQWRRLIPGSKIYHGLIKHFLINLVIRIGQLWRKLVN